MFASPERLEHELTPEPVVASATGSVLLHAGLVGAIVLYGILGGFLHRNNWGGGAAGSSVQVNLVSTAALPLPSTEPPNKNVLATEKPSQAPAPPAPVEKHVEDKTAIPIEGKPKKVERENTPKSPPRQQQAPAPAHTATYGEQTESSMPRVAAPTVTAGPASVSDASFGAMFPWYVTALTRKIDSNTYKSMADPGTPKGARVFIQFTINRDGSHSEVTEARSSGSPTWDSACMRAAQRVDSFGQLPAQYRGNTLAVSFYCEY